MMDISQEVRDELQWWLGNLSILFRPIYVGEPDLIINTDASLEGWGFRTASLRLRAGGRWTDQEQENHINYLEVKAVYSSILSHCKDMNGQNVPIMSDNTTTVVAINKQGSIRSRKINHLSRLIWLFVIDRELWLSAAHCPGTDNKNADKASRQFNDETEWTLENSIFSAICYRYGTPDIDLFAARNNNKVARYCAWQPDPGAVFIDAFHYNWGQGELLYMFPPFSIIGAILQKLIMEEGSGILIIPFWPTKPWFTQVARLLTDKPTIIPVTNMTLSIPGREKTHPMARKLNLLACQVSRKSSAAKDFRKGLQSPLKMPRASPHAVCTGHTSYCGMSFVCQNTRIQCIPLP